ncbi:hypothetical protein NHX12_014993 [Muraenolepis orangiensis]|uniref:Uncharacterized protein n=1 Tax=Muraenolepis orangiensis TaxID=630683 RepID=A0A9Q0D9L5_9TELE|nr:hypothetical protein NHX12_014993 [Muraenolepis orangiensis]
MSGLFRAASCVGVRVKRGGRVSGGQRKRRSFFLSMDVMSSCWRGQEEQAAKVKAEKIRVALEKIKEAQVKKLGLGEGKIGHCGFWQCVSESEGGV